MKILVCITHVPDTTTRITFTDNNTRFNTSGVQFIIGPYDDYALARGIELKDATPGTTLTALNVGEAETEPTIRKALAAGADDAIRINALPTDAWFVAEQIAAVAKAENYDLILMGRESIDFNGGQVHGMVAELLDIPCVNPVQKLDLTGTTARIDREIEGGHETIELSLPFVAGCQEPIAEWKIPSMRGIMSARTKQLKVVQPTGGEKLTSVKSFEMPPAKSGVKLIPADKPEELVRLLKTEAKVI
ncbi:MAG: electron transfer flavoprotein subunit beta/FixA family protein [Bacteroidota bacterium]